MKVLFAIPDRMSSGEESCGGMGNRYRNLLPGLKQFFDVRCVAYGKKEHDDWKGVKCYSFLPDFRVEEYSKPHAENLFTLHLTIAYLDFKPDVVVACDNQTFFAAVKLKKLYDFKLVIDFNLAGYSYTIGVSDDTMTPEFQKLARYVKWIEKIACEHADGIVTCSDCYTSEIPFKYSCEAITIPNGLDFDYWSKVVPKKKLKGNFKKKLLYIGRFNDQKGVRCMLEDDFKLPEGVSLHFVGGEIGSNLFNDVLKKCEERPDFFYEGFGDWATKKAFYEDCDAVLFPSIHEPFGIVGLEAGIMRKPLITSRNNGIATYCNKEHCFECVVKPLDKSNSVGISKGIFDWFNASDVVVEEKVDLFYKRVREFTWDKSIVLYKDFLNKLF